MWHTRQLANEVTLQNMLRTTSFDGEWTVVRRRKGKVSEHMDLERRKGQIHTATDKRPSHRGWRTGHQKGDLEAPTGGAHTHRGRGCTHSTNENQGTKAGTERGCGTVQNTEGTESLAGQERQGQEQKVAEIPHDGIEQGVGEHKRKMEKKKSKNSLVSARN